mmetsp:Transcript_34810/g.137304  ORF Transcript_34810/g.137304 Transcript_34810/m.137304 type:complete len:233 (-) Transcript_34810:4798-5496(-)
MRLPEPATLPLSHPLSILYSVDACEAIHVFASAAQSVPVLQKVAPGGTSSSTSTCFQLGQSWRGRWTPVFFRCSTIFLARFMTTRSCPLAIQTWCSRRYNSVAAGLAYDFPRSARIEPAAAVDSSPQLFPGPLADLTATDTLKQLPTSPDGASTPLPPLSADIRALVSPIGRILTSRLFAFDRPGRQMGRNPKHESSARAYAVSYHYGGQHPRPLAHLLHALSIHISQRTLP